MISPTQTACLSFLRKQESTCAVANPPDVIHEGDSGFSPMRPRRRATSKLQASRRKPPY